MASRDLAYYGLFLDIVRTSWLKPNNVTSNVIYNKRTNAGLWGSLLPLIEKKLFREVLFMDFYKRSRRTPFLPGPKK